jgi:hypothetical protein
MTPNNDGGGSAAHGFSAQKSALASSGFVGQWTSNYSKQGHSGKQHEGKGSDNEGEAPSHPPPPPSPSCPPQKPANKQEIVHCTDITLTVLSEDSEDRNNFLQVLTKVKVSCHDDTV